MPALAITLAYGVCAAPSTPGGLMTPPVRFVSSGLRSASQWLRETGPLRDLAARSDHLLRIQVILDESFPHLQLRAASLGADHVLLVLARSHSAAAKLRQSEPSLMAELARRGWQVSRIRFRPQRDGFGARGPATRRPAVMKPPIPAAALAGFAALAEQSSSEPLKLALANLVAHHRRRV